MNDPGLKQQEEAIELPELTPDGHPINEEITPAMMEKGLDHEYETPEETHVEGHPTPEHPTGRLTP